MAKNNILNIRSGLINTKVSQFLLFVEHSRVKTTKMYYWHLTLYLGKRVKKTKEVLTTKQKQRCWEKKEVDTY